MAIYTKTDWKNYPDTSTPLSAALLNHAETQWEQGFDMLTLHTTNSTGDGKHRWTSEKMLQGAGAAVPLLVDKWGIEKIVSDNLRSSHDAEFTTQSTVEVLAKTITINERMGGTLRIKFDLKTSNGAAAAYGQLKKNGVNIGAQQDTVGTDYVTKSQDIDIGDIVATNTLELWAKIGNAIYICSVRNLRLYYDDDATVISTTNS